MANNPYVNKVVYGNTTLIDITDTTAVSSDVLSGKYFYNASGQKVAGTNPGGSGSGVVWQDAQGYVHLSDEGDIPLQTKSVSPSETAQTVTADTGYYALDEVNVEAISSDYVGSGIVRRSSSDMTASGATVTVPSGYYASNATKTVASGTEGTPTATKGAVSSHSITVTPSVTNTAGYISGGTHNGTAVTVSASELVSGSETKTANGTYDVTNLAQIIVNVSGGGGGGLVYETGTWTPSEDVADYTISFVNAHTTAPFYYMIMDVGTTYNSTSNSNAGVIYYNWGQAFGEPLHYSSSSVRYGYVRKVISSGGNTSLSITYPHTSTTDTSASYPRYWAKETGIKADAYGSGYYWRAGRTYKWIAVWTPTT